MAARPRKAKVGTGKPMTAIRVAGLRKLFGGAPAVDDLVRRWSDDDLIDQQFRERACPLPRSRTERGESDP